MALRALAIPRGAEWLDHVLAVLGGAIDGYLADTMAWGYIIKNVAIPVVNIFMPLPKGLVHQAEGALGVLLYALLLRKKE